MVNKKMLATAAIAATALMSPAAALAKGGASGSGHNTPPPPPPECATITGANITLEPQINLVTNDINTYNRWVVIQRAQAVNCGTQTESLVWDISFTNTKTGVVEFPSAYNLPVHVAPGGSIDMAVADGVTGPEPGKSYRFDLSVKSGTTGKVLAQQSEYYTIQ